ncbi:MAG: DNA helicase [Myxococcota bacterium]|nr:DNA helicase [Myxococcota bacterium]
MSLSAPLHRLKSQAKAISRREGLPLHAALDRIAHQEGFRSWSHLSASQRPDPARTLLSALPSGSLSLLAGRPRQGKTRLGLELLALAAAQHPAWFFTLEYTPRDLRALGIRGLERVCVDTSDAISASHVLQALPSGAVAVIDYLQLLDQHRSLPPLQEQIQRLQAGAQAQGHRLVILSQIDRRFELSGRLRPTSEDIRMPNPVDLGRFAQIWVLHQGHLERC